MQFHISKMRAFINQSVLFAIIGISLLSCKQIREPDFKGIDNLRTTRLSSSQTTLMLDMHYFNPNSTKLNLKKADGYAWLDGNLLGKFAVDTMIRIPANADFRLPVTLELEMKNVLKNSMSALLKKEVILKIEGKARLGKSGFYINYPVNYEGKQNISELLK